MKNRLIVAIVLALALTAVLAAPASAKHKQKMEPLVMTANTAAGLPGHETTWYGTMAGDLNGTVESWGLDFTPNPLGVVSLPFAVYTGYAIFTTDCGVITTYNMGIWNLDTWEYRASGWVTEATGNWKYLIGWMDYNYGATTDPNATLVTVTDGFEAFLPPLPAKWGNLGM